MKTYGMENAEGSEILNLTMPTGTAFPGTPNVGELFYRTDSTAPFIHDGTQWAALTFGLDNVDNTSDATKNAAAVTLTNKTIASPTISGTTLITGNVTLDSTNPTMILDRTSISDACLTRYATNGTNNWAVGLDGDGSFRVAHNGTGTVLSLQTTTGLATLFGQLIVGADPTIDLGVATKQYVDTSVLVKGKNRIINGNFNIWQRGTSQTASGYMSADRWFFVRSDTTMTITREDFILGQSDVPDNPLHYSRAVVTSASTASSFVFQQQRLEGVHSLSGQEVTISFYAKADAPKNIATHAQQFFGGGGGGSPDTHSAGTLHALTTSWQKFTTTLTILSTSGKTIGSSGNDSLQITFWFEAGSSFNPRTGSLGNQSGTFDISQVQVEVGGTATGFEFKTIGEDLADCQRYYEAGGIQTFMVTNDINHYNSRGYAVQKRTNSPTMTVTPTSGTGAVLISNANGFSQSALHSGVVQASWTSADEF